MNFDPSLSDDGGATPPRRKELYKLFRAVLCRRFSMLPAMYKKEGDFVENGSLIHYEAQVHHFQDGLIEWASPECSGPMQLLAYSKAQEAVLLESEQPCREELQNRGHDGSLRILKNNVDVLGNNYGCHENYLVIDSRHWLRDLLKGICFVLFWVIFLPFYLMPRLVFLVFLTVMLSVLVCYFLLHLVARVPVVGWLAEPLAKAIDTLQVRHGSRIDEELIKHLALFMEWLYLPFVSLYSLFCRMFVFEAYRVNLTALLVTRQIYAGAGRIHATEEGQLFWLSQKAEFIRSVIRVFWNQRYKPIYDIKSYLLEPLSFFARNKRLHLLVGDSNLSEIPDYLKVAVAGLVIQVIEEADSTLFPVLSDPLEAVQRVAGDATFDETYTLTDGRQLTAIEIQREYLHIVREHYARRGVMPIWAPAALKRWEHVLDGLAESPESLHQQLDWIIKRRMMDRLLWGKMSWSELEAWAPVLAILMAQGGPEEAPAQAEQQVQELIDRLSARQSRRLERHLESLDRRQLPDVLSLYLALKKIDLKYHELSNDGYFQVLKRQGLVQGLLASERIDQAKVDPPPTTRAHVRGQFIKLAVRRKLTAVVSWTKIKISGRRKAISLRDPFQTNTDSLSVFR